MTQQIAIREAQPFQWMDAKDDEAIVLELKGVKSRALVYEFPQDGKTIRGLSKVGVEEATRELALGRGEVLRVLHDPTWRLDGEYYEVAVTAGRFLVNQDGREIPLDTTVGAKRQWTKMRLKSGEIVPDPFAFEKAISKAVRNAKHGLLPVDIIEAVIAKGQAQGRVVAAGEEAKPQPQDNRYACPKHTDQTWTKRTGKNGKSWYSHKDGIGWCNMADFKLNQDDARDVAPLFPDQPQSPVAQAATTEQPAASAQPSAIPASVAELLTRAAHELGYKDRAEMFAVLGIKSATEIASPEKLSPAWQKLVTAKKGWTTTTGEAQNAMLTIPGVGG